MENLPELPETTDLAEVTKPANEHVWEVNHAAIANAIMNHLGKHHTMPTKAVLADITGLTRLTVQRHLKSFNNSQVYQSQKEGICLMANEVMAQVLDAAIHGDLKAAKMYLEVVRELNNPPAGTMVNNQNNFIQINKTVINQQIIQQLKPAQIERIEQFITNELNQELLPE